MKNTSHKQQIRIGDTVTWTSQSQGSVKTKTGTVVAVVPPKEDPMSLLPQGMKLDSWGLSRPRESYLVQVGKQTRLYWPREGTLMKIEPAASVLGIANETGLTPRQLAEQRAELLAALNGITKEFEGLTTGIPALSASKAFKAAQVVIAKAEGKEGN